MADNKKTVWSKVKIRQAVDDLCEHGPSLEIGIAPIPFAGSFSQVLGQIDTGAGRTAISPRIAMRLALQPVDTLRASLPGLGIEDAPVFHVRLRLPTTDIDLYVAGIRTVRTPHDVLIGRDLLAKCCLAVDFTTGQTRLHFKS